MARTQTRIDWVNSIFLTSTLALALGLFVIDLYYNGANPFYFLYGLFFYWCSGLSITAGYHRLFSHRAYSAHPIIKFLFLFFGAGAFQNSALKWCSDHRQHHTKVDGDHDPYNINRGFFYAHMGWIMLQEKHLQQIPYAKDLEQDRLVQWQHRYYLILAILSGFVLPMLIGLLWGAPYRAFLYGGLLRIVAVHHGTFCINSLCHLWGKKTYDKTQTARDFWPLALITFGEGFHNFHHTFQTDYRNGIKWFHFDPTKWLIKSLSLVGLSWGLRSTPVQILAQHSQK